MKVGVSNNIFKGESLEFVIKVASFLDMDWVELKTDNMKETLNEAAALINSNPPYSKIQNFSVHAASKGITMLGSSPEQIAKHEQDLDFAKTIGADRVIFHAGYSSGANLRNELEQVATTIKHYLEYTEGTNILILIENTMVGRNKLCSDPKQLSQLMRMINHERVGVTLDIINLLGVHEEKQRDRYKKIKKWVRHIQINSRPIYDGDFKVKKFVKWFLKDLEFKKKLKTKKELKYNIPLIIEGKTSLARELHFIKELERKLK